MGHTYPWVDPLRTSHPKFLKPIQLQNNIGITLKKRFSFKIIYQKVTKLCGIQNSN